MQYKHRVMHKNVICFGEVLWDVFPSQRVAGGAPMNVAIRLQSLGVPAAVISKIGKDDPGRELLSIIQNKAVDTALVQHDETLPTGEVLVKLNDEGIATYDIVYPSAWDRIELNNQNTEAARNAEAFVFGSLACRDDISKNTLLALLDVASYKIFDVNLRPPFYDTSFVEQLMNKADFIKLNDEELTVIARAMGSTTDDLEENTRFIAEKTGTNTICVTRGKDGALLFAEGKFYSHSGYVVNVEDTVGSGDSFLAALINKLLNKEDYKKAIAYACATGAIVATYKGANPEISPSEIERLISN